MAWLYLKVFGLDTEQEEGTGKVCLNIVKSMEDDWMIRSVWLCGKDYNIVLSTEY